MIGTNREVESISGPQIQTVLVGKSGGHAEVGAQHRNDREALGSHSVEVCQRIDAMPGLDLARPKLESERGGELGYNPIADAEAPEILSPEPFLHSVRIGFIREDRHQQRGVEIEHQ
jgi:hypothetical protein